MLSIRKTSILVLAVTACVTQGCARRGNAQPNVSADPHQLDAAMTLRDWPQSVVVIPNGSTVAGSTGFAYEARRDQNKYGFYYADSGAFLLNVATMPYTFFRDGIAREKTFSGERTSATHTAVPPLPGGNTTVSPDPTPVNPMDTPSSDIPGSDTPGNDTLGNDASGTVDRTVPSVAPETPVETPAPSQAPMPSSETPAPADPPANQGGGGIGTMGGTV